MQDYWVDNLNDDFLQMLDSAKQLSSRSELHVKASEGDFPGIIEMMEKGYNPMNKDENGNTVLQQMVTYT